MKAIGPVSLAAALAILTALASAGAGPATIPTALDEVDRELQALFRQSRSHLVRAHIPFRVNAQHPMQKWRLEGDRRLREHLGRIEAGGEKPRLFIQPAPATTNRGGESGSSTQQAQPSTRISHALPSPGAWVYLECAGLVLNGRGDVLLPLYLDKVDHPLRIHLPDQQATTAALVASDEKTGLTIVRMQRAAGTPIRFADRRPEAGALVLMVFPDDVAVELQVWTGGRRESAIVFNRAGEVACICREGRSLYGAALAPLVKQLLETGRIRRAMLGARIREITRDDPHRLLLPLLGSRSAAAVEEVTVGSPGEAAGLAAGDIIIALAGEPFQDVQSLAAALGTLRGPTELRILRGGEEVVLTVDLQPR